MYANKKSWDILPEEKRKASLEKIISFFEKTRDEEIGVIAAEEILHFFLQTFGEDIYNKGVCDSKNILCEKFEDLKVDLDLLIN